VSSGKKVLLAQHLMPERPTVFVFLKPSSSLERSFLTELQRDAQDKVGFRIIHLKSGAEPVAQQHAIKETPTAIVYDRRARLVARSSDAQAIRTAVREAAGVMRIDWAEEGDPRLDAVRQMLGGQSTVPGILRTMSLRPDYLQPFMQLSMKAHFAPGSLDRRTKEMIATYVSALNKCKY
jgi:alkylhydroperoxidase/carboxymuconolactone decarboxylase family protein YurZ